MSDHYYSKTPSTTSERKQIKETIRDRTYTFTVDRGVFSRGGLDFGSRLLIETMEEPAVKGPIMDVGCGWGPIGISLSKEFSGRLIELVDVNERSVSLAKENAMANKADVRVYENNLLDGVEKESVAAVISNPPIRAGKQTIFALYEQAYDVLLPGGELWIVIQKKQGAASTLTKLEDLGFDVTTKAKSKGYFIYHAKKSVD
ncbi:class I SAM-dependent methyltransferase [Paenalkalicoccus suaedae]|uniref:Class I SAM-dependent methyltransferase n=1 Tax=Paenalkalicoccus suaedae TaxID=2592382 RepID=A0A859F9Z9_9BACI|nr:methyltransferase [Paenalkalicoccus suaedae]QKS69690.1 class I SAM-dependent methyltransferase [Paenalkalicoccus suaedae]